MPIKRRLTKAEVARKYPGNRSAASAFTEYTFLTDEEREQLVAADERGDTVEEFLEHLGDVADKDVIAKELERTRNARAAAARRRDRAARQPSNDEPVRERQVASPTNPFGAYLDPRHFDLPEYPAAGHTQRKRLKEAAQDYRDAASVLEAALDSMTAVRDRINNTANSKMLAEHRKRVNRIG